MATAVSYSLPAAANYYSPGPSSYKHHQQQQQHSNRGYRVCDQCGAVETPGARFRLCGGCMTTQYCSQECQKVHWPSHKSICQHTQSLISSSSSSPAAAAAAASSSPENLAKHLRKFTSAHSDLLGWAGFQALQLKRVPAHIRQKALLIELEYLVHQSGETTMEGHRRFRLAATHIVSRSYVHDPLVLADIARREDRSRRTGGVGTLLVIIQCAGISQVVPVEVDPPAKITWDERADWEEVVRRFVAEGRTDFKPISTTEFGIVYG
ncbi:hypothetical protein APHAL10511_008107 [Amanita phalloides]|nr:hypothetical protein APHAL10511_008107 [Amanita phalloides]